MILAQITPPPGWAIQNSEPPRRRGGSMKRSVGDPLSNSPGRGPLRGRAPRAGGLWLVHIFHDPSRVSLPDPTSSCFVVHLLISRMLDFTYLAVPGRLDSPRLTLASGFWRIGLPARSCIEEGGGFRSCRLHPLARLGPIRYGSLCSASHGMFATDHNDVALFSAIADLGRGTKAGWCILWYVSDRWDFSGIFSGLGRVCARPDWALFRRY